MNRYAPALVVILCNVLLASSSAQAEDWPMWRHDAARSATTSQELPDQFFLHWVRDLPTLEPAWADVVNQDRMGYDSTYEPIVVGTTMFIASNRNDSLLAIDSRTGSEKWRFYADGPIRFAPVVEGDRLFVVSDDGYLYALNSNNGELLWKVRGGPDDRRVTGNNRLISMWPARGGPVAQDGTVYFAAGIWPFMGVFVHAIDVESGQTIWRNDTLGTAYIDHPHGGSTSFGGIAPQGALALIGDKLIVPGGRSVPACLDAATGELLYFRIGGSSYHEIGGSVDRKREGGSHVSGVGNFFLNHRGINTSLYDLTSGDMVTMWQETVFPVLDGNVCFLSGESIVAYNLAGIEKTGEGKKSRWHVPELGRFEVDATGALIKAGSKLYAGGDGMVTEVRLDKEGPSLGWASTLRGKVTRLLAADSRLYVVTDLGKIYAFGADVPNPPYYPIASEELELTPAASARAQELLKYATLDQGYCLVHGLVDGDLLRALADRSELHVVGVDSDAAKVDRLRRQLDDEGLYGTRISLLVGEPETFAAPQYMAVLITSELTDVASHFPTAASLETAYSSLRPYGGAMVLSAGGKTKWTDRTGKLTSANATVGKTGNDLTIVRTGALPGSAPWTHQSGDIANTSKSDDQLVKAPLGVLWFGATSHDDVLPRHSHGPPEQVIGGRLFVEGDNSLSARDVYTGKPLWTRTFDDLGTFGIYYDESYVTDPLDTTYNQGHIAGANARGTNYVATEEYVYLVIGSDCLVLDATDGTTLKTFTLPAEADGETPEWTYLGVYQDLLIAGADFVTFSDEYGFEEKNVWDDFDHAASHKLLVMDRTSGKVLWARTAGYAFRHNAITVGGDKLFCIDSFPSPVLEAMKRRGETLEHEPILRTLAVRSGEELWSTTDTVFGTALAYSAEHKVLLESGRKSRDMLGGEPTDRMRVFKAKDGDTVWDRQFEYGGPCMLHHDTIYMNAVSNEGAAVELLTGDPTTRVRSLTGQTEPWTYQRSYGCNSVVASEHLLTFRSGGAGYYDLNAESGTGNLSGFKSGCTANLIAADGLLNAPDYTRTCTCAYPNQTSLALVHMPDVETWATDAPSEEAPAKQRIERVGINFGAPGDRRDEEGTLWLDYPSVGGPSPEIEVNVEGTVEYFRVHSSRVADGEKPWVVSSGLEGATTIRLKLRPTAKSEDAAASYTVRLYFLEPSDVAAGDRRFNVAIQGEQVWKDVDPAKQAGGPWRALVKQAQAVKVDDELVINLTASTDLAPILCGVEAVLD